ncbi:MAG: hypothetical protein ACK5NT_03720 [Pyrinomonadaceae bacterium]
MNKIFFVLFFALFSVGAFAQKPEFKDFAAKVEKVKAKSVNFKNNKSAHSFRTRLRESFAEGVNFGGRYIVSVWGCGTDCLQAGIIDGRTGNVYFPEPLQGASFGLGELSETDKDTFEFKPNSRLFIVNGYSGTDDKREEYGIWYYEWTGKTLKLIKFEKKKTTGDS